MLILAKGEGLRAVELLAVAQLAHLPLASVDMIRRVHANVILGHAATAVLTKESAVATVQDIHFRVGQ